MGDHRGKTFIKLLELLVHLVLLYGAKAWGCPRQLESIERVQMRATRAVVQKVVPEEFLCPFMGVYIKRMPQQLQLQQHAQTIFCTQASAYKLSK